jgi:hypothetical protein
MSTVRYPSEFQATPNTDYIQIEKIIRDYSTLNQKGQDDIGTYNQSGVNQYKVVGDPNTLIMNMPQKIGEQIAQNWRNSSLGPEGSNMLMGRTSIGKDPAAFGLGIIRRMIENSLLGTATTALGKVGASNINENSILSATSGVIYNPMMEVLYDGPEFRTFNFQFVLFAKSEKDAAAIKKIVRFFQNASVPSYTGQVNSDGLAGVLASSNVVDLATQAAGGLTDIVGSILGGKDPTGGIFKLGGGALGNLAKSAAILGTGNAFFGGDNRFIKQPPFLRITYRRGTNQHPYILPLKPCAINNMSIDYTPTGNYTVLDNFGNETVATVVATNITLGLIEVKTIFAEDYYNNGVAFNKTAY